MDTPLDDLLLELNAELHLSSIADPDFVGAAVQHRNGNLILWMPPGQPRVERDTVARAMLGHAIGVPLGALPEPYQLTEL
ncbi:hypothetical protein [Streptomyces sp. NPDC059802]|uniref:hypothetical protein n=1 Tax=Streptomyces sp. NPDC059802 TaxID=3346952 RepID=UPI00366745C3